MENCEFCGTAVSTTYSVSGAIKVGDDIYCIKCGMRKIQETQSWKQPLELTILGWGVLGWILFILK